MILKKPSLLQIWVYHKIMPERKNIVDTNEYNVWDSMDVNRESLVRCFPLVGSYLWLKGRKRNI